MILKMELRAGSRTVATHLLMVLALGLGCSKETTRSQPPPEAKSASNAADAAKESRTNGSEKTLVEMLPDDVVVAVNGVALTKKQLEDGFTQAYQRMSQMPRMSKGKLAAFRQYLGRSMIPGFINRQLMVQEARRTGILGPADIKTATDEWILHAAKLAGKPVSAFLEQVPGGAASLRKEAEESVLIDAMIATNVLPKVNVTDRFVEKTIKAIKEENAAADATNALKVARLNTLREQILAGADFGKLADINSQCPRSAPGNNGYWGEFDRRELADKKMQDAVTKLKPGELSEVLSDDEGFHLVKVLARTGAAASESFTLAHIMLEREPALEMAVPSDLKKQLIEQRKDETTRQFIEALKAKAVITYPNGTNFWPKVSQKPAGLSAKTSPLKK